MIYYLPQLSTIKLSFATDVQLHAGVYDNVNLNDNIFRITLFLSSVQTPDTLCVYDNDNVNDNRF